MEIQLLLLKNFWRASSSSQSLHWRNHGFERGKKKEKKDTSHMQTKHLAFRPRKVDAWLEKRERNFPGYFSRWTVSPAKSRKLILNLVRDRGISCSFNLRERSNLKKKKKKERYFFAISFNNKRERERERTASFIYHRRSFYFRRGIYIIAFPQTRRYLSPKIFITAYHYYTRVFAIAFDKMPQLINRYIYRFAIIPRGGYSDR